VTFPFSPPHTPQRFLPFFFSPLFFLFLQQTMSHPPHPPPAPPNHWSNPPSPPNLIQPVRVCSLYCPPLSPFLNHPPTPYLRGPKQSEVRKEPSRFFSSSVVLLCFRFPFFFPPSSPSFSPPSEVGGLGGGDKSAVVCVCFLAPLGTTNFSQLFPIWWLVRCEHFFFRFLLFLGCHVFFFNHDP